MYRSYNTRNYSFRT